VHLYYYRKLKIILLELWQAVLARPCGKRRLQTRHGEVKRAASLEVGFGMTAAEGRNWAFGLNFPLSSNTFRDSVRTAQ